MWQERFPTDAKLLLHCLQMCSDFTMSSPEIAVAGFSSFGTCWSSKHFHLRLQLGLKPAVFTVGAIIGDLSKRLACACTDTLSDTTVLLHAVSLSFVLVFVNFSKHSTTLWSLSEGCGVGCLSLRFTVLFFCGSLGVSSSVEEGEEEEEEEEEGEELLLLLLLLSSLLLISYCIIISSEFFSDLSYTFTVANAHPLHKKGKLDLNMDNTMKNRFTIEMHVYAGPKHPIPNSHIK